jgi:tetratricopeptide (TPR) repeat protein
VLLCRVLAGIALAAATAPQSRLSEARRLQNEGDYPRAIALLEDHLSEETVGADGDEARALLAWLYTMTGKRELAVTTYRSLLSRHPEAADLHNSLGALLFKERELEEAKRELETAVSLDPSLVMAHYNLGLLKFEQGELEGAAGSFERAIELDPDNTHYHFSLARAYRASYRFAEAAGAFRAGLALSPPPDVARPARLELALTLKHDGRLEDSETELRNLLSADAADGEALFQLGRLYLAMSRYPEAEEVFRKLTRVSPENAPAHFMLGLVSYREDALDNAQDSFRRLLELSPNHAEGRYYLGMSRLKLGDRGAAREAFEETLRIDPEHVSAIYNLALLLAKEGERQESERRLAQFRELGERRQRVEALEARVRWDPGNARFHLDLGQEYSRQKRAKEALQAFQRALEIQPDLAAAEIAIANLLSSREP